MTIKGVIVKSLNIHKDQRGWLAELFRNDQLPPQFKPAMSYISVTHQGQKRGPHEHKDQTDAFAFISGEFELHLWENRPGQKEQYIVLKVGEQNPTLIFVPPGVVHAYKNIGTSDAYILNFPNQLYAGQDKKEPIDEIRYEQDLYSRFKL